MNQGLNDFLSYRRKNKLSVVNIGLKVFSKNKGNQISAVDYRILQEGLEVLLPFMNEKRIVKVSKEVFLKFTQNDDGQITFDSLKEDWKLDKFLVMDIGSAVMLFDDFAVTVWVGKNNVSLMVSKEEINSIKSLM